MRGLVLSFSLFFSLNLISMQPAISANAAESAQVETLCLICRENIDTTKACSELICGHNFHKNCIKGWKKSGRSNADRCPTCRGPMKWEYAIVDAVVNGKIQKVLEGLKHVNINRIGSGGTFLMIAVDFNQIDLVRILVQQPGIDLNVFDDDGQSALLLAIKNQSLECINILIYAGCKLVSKDPSTDPMPLMRACADGNSAIVDKLIKAAPESINDWNDKDWTPFVYAASTNQLHILHYLVGVGVDRGESFVRCAQAGFVCGLAVLHSWGVDINAVEAHEDDLARSAINYAVINKHWDVLDFLLRKGADINHQDELGYTPLIECCLQPDRYYMAQALLHAPGINIELKDEVGFTALYHAVKEKQPIIFKLLIEKGAQLQPEILNSDEVKSAFLYYSAVNNNLEFVRTLLRNGAQVTDEISSKLSSFSEEIQAELMMENMLD